MNPPPPSSYAVSHSVADRLRSLRQLRGPAMPGFTSKVRELVLIASSSRSGSSMLAEFLRRSTSLLHMRAEFNPFLRLVGLAFPLSGTGSDRLDASDWLGLPQEQRHVLEDELALDVGYPCPCLEDEEQFLRDAAWRFAVQWPDIDIDPAAWLATARTVLSTLRRWRVWSWKSPDVVRFQLELLRELSTKGFVASPWYYDIPGHWLRRDLQGPPPKGAPGDVILEEPPFTLPRVWRRPEDAEVEAKALVIKTPSNAYRTGFLRALFPVARIRVIHLTRNPAASINGLFDGWCHRGFHSHRMPEPLQISGYGEDCPNDRWWWKFDLPPGWQTLTHSPLLNVCAFQWNASQVAILDDLEAGQFDDYVRIRFESLIGSSECRQACLSHLSAWLQIPFDPALRRVARDGVEPVAATAPPSPRRWCRRADLIRPVI